MAFSRENVKNFLLSIGSSPDSVDMGKVYERFYREMEEGLTKKGSSLNMIPTFCDGKADVKGGDKAIVIDAGGTNLRTCLVTVNDEKKAEVSLFRKTAMPGIRKSVSAKEFFSVFADEVERLIDLSDNIGFCYSYAAAITPGHDGITFEFGKEIKAPEVLGMKIGESLLKELGRRGHDVSKKKVCVINDTVATLLAAKAEYPENVSGYIGFILGTGTNSAYLERNTNITKMDGLDEDGSQIINVESGALRISFGSADDEFFSKTTAPEVHRFEKLISGAYLGAYSELVVKKAIERGLFSKRFAESFGGILTLSTTEMSHFLEDPLNMSYPLVAAVGDDEDDSMTLNLILRSIIERAAKLTCVNISCAVMKADIGKNSRYPAIVNADGTTYYKTAFLKEYTENHIHSFLEDKLGRYVKFVRIDDSPVLGAAIAGLSV